MGFLAQWLVVGIALAVTVYLVPGVVVTSTTALLLAALVLGLVNALVRPVLTLLTLPLTILTLGLFYLVVNGVAFALAAAITPGFHLDGFGSAIIGALLVSIVSWLVGLLIPS